MSDEPTFEAMRKCAKGCVTAPFGSLPEKLDCSYPYQNECLCRVDLAGVASKYLTSCVLKGCTAGPADADVSSVMGIYNSYCLSNGFDVTAAPAVATSAGSSSNNGVFGSRTTAGPTQTASSEDGAGPPTSGGGLSTGALIGIILPIVSITVGLIGIAVKIYFGRKRKTDGAASNGSFGHHKDANVYNYPR